ncbi:MAG: NADH-quinone oxidoreductase subunit NuoG, partial [Actinomycetota bacterium]|nr:NADH-quinone oxidoreductase subunit NuoG [Actinomycetota bacterium]
DVEIPVFCYEPKLGGPVGACRMCLVEVEGIPKLQTACSTPVRDGMVVYTQTDQVKEAQNAVVEFLLVNHPLDCPVCDKGGECPLQDIAMGWGPGKSRFTDPKRHFQKPLELSPLVAIDRERCILCYRCVRFSQEVAEDEQLQLLERGDKTFVGTFDERPYIAPFHGNIIELCPVGALTSYTYRFKARPWDIEQAGSICTLCPSQCNVAFTVRDEHVVRVLARDNKDVDDGWLCDKGRFAYQMLSSDQRISEPMVRDASGRLTAVSWERAMDAVSDGLREAGERTAAIVGGGTSNEEGWLIQRALRASGSADIDCSTTPVDPQLLAELSRPELSARMSDIDHAGAVLVLGTDPLHEMPILDLRIRKAVRRAKTKLAVASPRPTALDGGAVEAVRYPPGEDAAFVAALAAALEPGRAEDGPYASDAAEIAELLRSVPDPIIVWGERLWRSPGAVEALHRVARSLGMHQTIGPGMLEVPEDTNTRGLREVGCLPDAGPGFSEALPGRNAAEIRDALASGELSAVLLANADPVRTHPDSDGWRRALEDAFVVSIAMFEDASTSFADVVIPAESHAEKEGTVTHPDGRLQRVRPNAAHPHGVRNNWQVLAEISAGLCEELAPYYRAEDVFRSLGEEVAFYGPTDYEEIGGVGVRWQERDPGASWTPRGGGGAGGVASGADSAVGRGGSEGGSAPAYAPSTTPPTPATVGDRTHNGGSSGGLLLGTYRDLWASEVTERNPALRFLAPAQKLELAPGDAKELELSNGDPVTVSANGASVEARVAINSRMRAGAAFLIEGTKEGNANVLADGVPRRVEVAMAVPELTVAEGGGAAE